MKDRAGWDGGEIDLDAYFARIGYHGERAPTLETLKALQRAHVTGIPFENLDAVHGRPVLLDVPSLQAKLVGQRRGGYCFEHVRLFAAALERLGFAFTGLTGRVTIGSDDMRPATHAVLRVVVDGRAWLCDVGFGGGPLEPIELRDGIEVDQDGWRFRLERSEGELGNELWIMHQFGADGWVDRHMFTLDPQYPIDYEVGNHFVSTHPRSPFAARPYAQRFAVDVHHVLDDLKWTTTRPDGRSEVRELEPGEREKVLEEVFGIVLPG
ncbi:arylamine N-acetyltransferase family protein [Actinomadura macrotermitis]|uniref:Arylamine N-acetyltransferase n=1 Tax=Actinomadura macrotermitis TaxID=2585200 RepID=A0A7K0BTU9_9ACTN|nr:arylamine N-acetyltransferase [Actinomadura macrotermitis]MQY04610.1 hypothetical protein [Actinomadura macrotermitis]